jgi:transcriptional regulator with XRE-family HTH domain
MPTTEDVSTSKSLGSLRQELINNKDDKAYRNAYADESLNISVATQLKVLRQQRELTQEELAVEAGMQQPMISRYENVNYSSWSINTLKKLAVALDVWLDVRFRSFGELVRTTEEFSRKSLQVPTFADDPFFKEIPAIAAQAPAVGQQLPPSSPLQHPNTMVYIIPLARACPRAMEGEVYGAFPVFPQPQIESFDAESLLNLVVARQVQQGPQVLPH